MDVFVVPDYKLFFEGNIDPKFARYAKEENSVLQFIFEEDDKFPLGVKTTYKKYSSDQ